MREAEIFNDPPYGLLIGELYNQGGMGGTSKTDGLMSPPPARILGPYMPAEIDIHQSVHEINHPENIDHKDGVSVRTKVTEVSSKEKLGI